jgi:hypothetical protein
MSHITAIGGPTGTAGLASGNTRSIVPGSALLRLAQSERSVVLQLRCSSTIFASIGIHRGASKPTWVGSSTARAQADASRDLDRSVGGATHGSKQMTNDEYAIEQQALAAAWKKRTPALWPAARKAAPWINQDGKPVGRYAHCLPAEHAIANLLPDNHDYYHPQGQGPLHF